MGGSVRRAELGANGGERVGIVNPLCERISPLEPSPVLVAGRDIKLGLAAAHVGTIVGVTSATAGLHGAMLATRRATACGDLTATAGSLYSIDVVGFARY